MVSDVVDGLGRGQIMQAWVLVGIISKQWEASRGCETGRGWVWLMF